MKKLKLYIKMNKKVINLYSEYIIYYIAFYILYILYLYIIYYCVTL